MCVGNYFFVSVVPLTTKPSNSFHYIILEFKAVVWINAVAEFIFLEHTLLFYIYVRIHKVPKLDTPSEESAETTS